jgi:hypothetical protein
MELVAIIWKKLIVKWNNMVYYELWKALNSNNKVISKIHVIAIMGS